MVHKIILSPKYTFRPNKIFIYLKHDVRFALFAGFNPVWYDTLRFIVHTPELAMVRFVVEDYDKTSKNDFVGQYVLPFGCMQQGTFGQTSPHWNHTMLL